MKPLPLASQAKQYLQVSPAPTRGLKCVAALEYHAVFPSLPDTVPRGLAPENPHSISDISGTRTHDHDLGRAELGNPEFFLVLHGLSECLRTSQKLHRLRAWPRPKYII